MDKNETQFNLLLIVLGILFFAFAFVINHFTNLHIESQCVAKGGQVFSTPFQISSCLHSVN